MSTGSVCATDKISNPEGKKKHNKKNWNEQTEKDADSSVQRLPNIYRKKDRTVANYSLLSAWSLKFVALTSNHFRHLLSTLSAFYIIITFSHTSLQIDRSP